MSGSYPSSKPQAPRTPERRCVITGAAGFLGRYLCREMADAGYEVTGVGRGPSPGLRWGVRQFVELELPCSDLREIVAQTRPEVCIHAAGLGELTVSSMTPRVMERQALAALASLLDAIDLGHRRSRVILISSAAVYGRPAELPATETMLRQPHTPYGRHKLDCELLVERFSHRTGVRASIARVFNAYGPEQRRQVLWNVCRRANTAADGRVELRGGGQVLRDFIHVEDVSRAVRLMAENKASDADILNLCTGQPTAIHDVIAMIQENWPTPIEFVEATLAGHSEADDMVGDPSRIHSLGFQPKWDLGDGLRQYVDWFLNSQAPVFST